MTRKPPRLPRTRALTEEEAQLWEYVTRHDFPLELPEVISPPPKAVRKETIPAALPARKPAAKGQPLGAGEYAGVDRASAQRLKRGKRLIEARLDLHGFRQDEAYEALSGFIAASANAGQRVVLVITGYGRQGKPGEAGVLRRALPRWLNEASMRRYVLAFDTAKPKDGGEGAFYILLRRERR